MQVTLGPERESFVRSRISAGEFASPDELIEEALRLMEEREEFLHLNRQSIGAKIQAGWDSLKQGRSVDGETALGLLKDELA
jgi:antitoxin ParD1/3/4